MRYLYFLVIFLNGMYFFFYGLFGGLLEVVSDMASGEDVFRGNPNFPPPSFFELLVGMGFLVLPFFTAIIVSVALYKEIKGKHGKK